MRILPSRDSIVRFVDNAMLFKDITQWLRNRMFGLLFLGLFTVAFSVALMFSIVPTEESATGPIIFSILTVILCAYSLVIAIQGHQLTSGEFQNRTFELYELSGMSLEGMIIGKLVSLLVQFSIGFFAIIPFIFLAYNAGGLDFLLVVFTILMILLAAPPFYLMAHGIAVASRMKALANLVRAGFVVGVIFFVPSILMWIIGALFFSGGVPSVGTTIAGIQFHHVALFVWFYCLICLTIFYLSCNAISPITDSRETAVKFFSTLLLLSWWIFMGYFVIEESSEESAALAGSTIYWAMLAMGLAFFNLRREMPIMEFRRYQRSRWWKRPYYWIFRSGSEGTSRVLVLIWLCVALSAYSVVVLLVSSGRVSLQLERFLSFATLPLVVPFYIGLPSLILVNLRPIRRNPQGLRSALLVWWIFFGAVFTVGWSIVMASTKHRLHFYNEIIELAGILFTPICGQFFGLMESSDLYSVLPFYRLGLGVLGIFMMTLYSRRLSALQRSDRLKAQPALERESTSAPAGAVAPEPVAE